MKTCTHTNEKKTRIAMPAHDPMLKNTGQLKCFYCVCVFFHFCANS